MSDPLPSDTFAGNVRSERERQGISQAQLSRRMAEEFDAVLDPSAITRIEAQTRAVRLDEAVAIAGVLGVQLATLLEAHEDETTARLAGLSTELEIAFREWARLGDEIDRLTRQIRLLRGGAPLPRSQR